MTTKEAKEIIRDLAYKSHLEADEEFVVIEAYEYLIEQTKSPRWMEELGGYYYEQKEFDLALKYYEMAETYGSEWAPEGLGYIWYYGRTGETDYEKAFRYYCKASENGYVRSTMKVADMYKNGYYVDRDYDKYVEMIERAYEQVRDEEILNAPKPEVFIRLARIRVKQGHIRDAIDLYMDAKDFLAERLSYNPFFGDLTTMEWLIRDLAELRSQMETERREAGSGDAQAGRSGDVSVGTNSSDAGDGTAGDDAAAVTRELDLYDLFELLKAPCKVQFWFEGEAYEAEAVREEDGSVAVRFLGKWYRSVSDFFNTALLAGDKLPVLYYELDGFEVM